MSSLAEIQHSQINSAEMTAYWRSLEPTISGDALSVELASDTGIRNAQQFTQKFDYPLVARLIAVRAGYFLQQALRLLQTGQFDGCISIASGFSLLTYYLASNPLCPPVSFMDTDLPHVITLRQERLGRLGSRLNGKVADAIPSLTFDLDSLTQGASLKDSFKGIKKPLILLEGISYFIASETFGALLQELSSYEHAAFIFDYFPDDAATRSTHFAHKASKITQFAPKIIHTLGNARMDKHHASRFSMVDHSPVQEAEQVLCESAGLKPTLLDENEFFPTCLAVLKKTSPSTLD